MSSSWQGQVFDWLGKTSRVIPSSFKPRDTNDVVLYFHSVGDPQKPGNISERKFKNIVKYCYEQYQISSLEEVVNTRSHNKRVALTFDDAREDFYKNVLPFLIKHELSATLFVVDRWIGIDGFMNKSEVKDAISRGVTIGNHTLTHPHLSNISYERKEDEIIRAKNNLESKFDTSVTQFSYPYGDYDDDCLKIVQDSHEIAVTTYPRVITEEFKDTENGRCKIPRIPVYGDLVRIKFQMESASSTIRSVAEKVGLISQ